MSNERLEAKQEDVNQEKEALIDEQGRTCNLDDKTRMRMKDCTRFGFPICLDRGIVGMFGNHGKKKLDAIVMNDSFENTEIGSPKDIWSLFEKYVEHASSILGDDVADVIEFEVLKEIQLLSCTKCPVHQMIVDRRSISRKV